MFHVICSNQYCSTKIISAVTKIILPLSLCGIKVLVRAFFLISLTWIGTLELNFKYISNKSKIVRTHHTVHETGFGTYPFVGL